MQEWEVPREGEWIVVSENLKFFRHRYLSFKNEVENFGVVSTSNARAYKELEKKLTFHNKIRPLPVTTLVFYGEKRKSYLVI